jgi:hypothetical protein
VELEKVYSNMYIGIDFCVEIYVLISDGTACSMHVNTMKSHYCQYHIGSAYRKQYDYNERREERGGGGAVENSFEKLRNFNFVVFLSDHKVHERRNAVAKRLHYRKHWRNIMSLMLLVKLRY